MKKALSFLLALVLCLSLCACGSESNNAEQNEVETNSTIDTQTDSTNIPEITETEVVETKPEYVRIELTSENFFEYFEIVATERIEENAFGEIELWMTDWSIEIKEDYNTALIGDDTAVELSYSLGIQEVIVDYENKSYTITDNFEPMMEASVVAELNSGYYYLSSDSFSMNDSEVSDFTNHPKNFEVMRVQGSISLTN